MNGEEERKKCIDCEKMKTIRSFKFNKWTNDYVDCCYFCSDIRHAMFCELMGIRQ